MTFGCSMWSPNGQQLATEAWSVSDPAVAGIFRVNSDGSDPVRLTSNGNNGHDIPGDWSPDGKHIAFARNVGNGSELWVVDVADGATRRLIGAPTFSAGSWSPDGQWIVTVRGRDFVMVHPDGTGYRTVKIPVTQINEPSEPSFAPDGTRLVFSMKLPGSDNADVYTMKIDGTDIVQVTNTPNDNEYGVDWGIDPK
jgi:Tol biopolymer transport system component